MAFYTTPQTWILQNGPNKQLVVRVVRPDIPSTQMGHGGRASDRDGRYSGGNLHGFSR